MKYCNILLSALATVMTLTGIMPCGACAADAVRAASLGHNKAIADRVYEEGLNLGRFEVPYSPGFVGHGSTSTFTVTVHNTLAERDLAAVHWTARGTSTGTGTGLGFSATGRAVQVTGTTPFRMADGRIAEEWTCATRTG